MPFSSLQIRYPWETEVILICRKPSNSILPSLLFFCESTVKIKTSQDMLFSFPSRLLPWTVNYSLSISIKTAEEWLFWAYTELLITPQASDCDVPWLENNVGMLCNKHQTSSAPLLPEQPLKGWPQSFKTSFFVVLRTLFAMLLKMEIATSPILLPLAGKDAPEWFSYRRNVS